MACFRSYILLCLLMPLALAAKAPYIEGMPPRNFLMNPDLTAYTMVKYREDIHKPKSKNEFDLGQVLELEKKLLERIHGQNKPVQLTVQSLVRYAAGLCDPEGPIATLLYIGPTGVGKTELAKQLALQLTGNKANLIRIDLSEYAEPHTVSKLIGTPPGYVGFDRGGQLTQAIKQHPNAIVLLDEIEKAHPNVLQIFLQAFDDARITDAHGESVDCKKCLFILTTNLAAQPILKMQKEGVSYDEILKAVQPLLMQQLTPELYNRVDPVIFSPLDEKTFEKIVKNELSALSQRLMEKRRIQLRFDGSLVAYLCQKGYQYDLGARPLRRLIDKEVVTPLSYALVKDAFASGETLVAIIQNEKVVLKKEK